jgi:hypothetical protein
MKNVVKVSILLAMMNFAMSGCGTVAQGGNQSGSSGMTTTTLEIGANYNLKVGSDRLSTYRFVNPRDGNITLTLESFAESTYFAIYNGNGASLAPTNTDIVSGKIGGGIYNPFSGTYGHSAFNSGDIPQICSWNPTIEKFNGSFTFKLDAGTYIFRIIRSQTGLSTANLLISLK